MRALNKLLMAALILFFGSLAFGQNLEYKLAPRSALLTQTAGIPSARGLYVITFPPPNQCITIPNIKANSRGEALYIAISHGGFSLRPSLAGLTVWTIEEWETAQKDDKYFFDYINKRCANGRFQF